MDIIDKFVERFRTGDSERKLVFWKTQHKQRQSTISTEVLGAPKSRQDSS